MDLELAHYPATTEGAEALVSALRSHVESLWREGRKTFGTDDLIVLVTAETNRVRVHRRTSIYARVKRQSPKLSLLTHLAERPPNTPSGTIRIWAFIKFADGNQCIVPVTLAQS